ncbi:hypothetical protein [Paenibacillus sp. BR2-3]|uniref:hypothetical protein n=1 Tax=Paenibacillus sp. BR2-3 TaxID=3048494 RepID=UPI003977284E
MKERCTKATGNREVVVSLEQLKYQNQAREILRSEEGYALAVRRIHGTRKCIWTTEKQPELPAISASRYGKSDTRGRLAFTCSQSIEASRSGLQTQRFF